MLPAWHRVPRQNMDSEGTHGTWGPKLLHFLFYLFYHCMCATQNFELAYYMWKPGLASTVSDHQHKPFNFYIFVYSI